MARKCIEIYFRVLMCVYFVFVAVVMSDICIILISVLQISDIFFHFLNKMETATN